MLKHKRLISIIATIAFCLSFLAPAIIAPAPALAAGDISAITVPVVKDKTDNATLGTVKVVVPAGSVTSGDVVIFELPDDCEFATAVDYTGDNRLDVPPTIGADKNGFVVATASILEIAGQDKSSFQIRVKSGADMLPGWDGVFYIYLGDINIDKGVKGDLTATLDGPVGFTQGSVVVARTSSDSAVTLTTSSLVTANDDFTLTLRIREDVAGALKKGADSLVLTLPDGFDWDKAAPSVNKVWGDNWKANFVPNKDELAITVTTESGKASAWDLELKFEVVNESRVEAGDIMVKVKGKSKISPKEIKVGTYGDFGVKAFCDEPTEVFAGKLAQEIGDFTIEETIKASLIKDRSITLTLPSYAKWTKIDKYPDGLTFSGVAGSQGNVLKYTIDDTSTKAVEIDFEDFEVALDVTAPGDLVVEIAGTAGVKAEVVVAKIALPVTMAAENATEVKIGSAAQKIGDLTITESVAEAIAQDKEIWLKVPAGVEWAKIPTITVESGDLKLDLDQAIRAKSVAGQIAPTDYYQYIVIPVDRDSNEPSVIKLTDCYVTVDRTVPEGSLTVALLGSAVLNSNTAYGTAYMDAVQEAYGAITVYPYPLDLTGGVEGYRVGSAGMFPQTAAIAGAAAATVVTPAGSQGRSAVFYIGSTIMSVNGVNTIMDVAPYIKAGRTYVPVRYMGEALGADIAWDEATKTVTVTKGENTVVLVIGSTIAKVNGADVQMDVAPEIVNGRTMLPARWVAEGLGYQVGWNEILKQVVIQ